MDRDKFKTNIGRTVQFLPHPRRDSASGSWESDMNTWLFRGEIANGKFEFLNAICDHDPLILDLSQMRNCDAPDKLLLRGQIIVKGKSVLFEPFHPKPASPSIPNTSLHLSLEGADENGTRVFFGPTVYQFIFFVANRSQQTVRDYRVSILVPSSFIQPSFGSFKQDLPKTYATSVREGKYGEGVYSVYEMAISQPIYGNGRIRIGEVHFGTALGNHIILWKIQCDDGVFPSETTYGEIVIKTEL